MSWVLGEYVSSLAWEFFKYLSEDLKSVWNFRIIRLIIQIENLYCLIYFESQDLKTMWSVGWQIFFSFFFSKQKKGDLQMLVYRLNEYGLEWRQTFYAIRELTACHILTISLLHWTVLLVGQGRWIMRCNVSSGKTITPVSYKWASVSRT